MKEKWLQIENLPATLVDGRYILNLRNEHWVVIVLQKPLCFIFDPLSTRLNKKDIPTKHKGLVTWLKSHGFTKVIANDIPIQPIKSQLCGYFCLYFVKHLPKGHLSEEDFDQMILSHFKSGNDGFNVKHLIEWCNKVGLT